MADDGYVFSRDGAKRIVSAVRKIEEAPPLVDPTPVRQGQFPGLVRAILTSPLYGHGSSLAMKCERVVSYEMQDVQIVGSFGLTDNGPARFRLSMQFNGTRYDSTAISPSASADEFLAALAPWTFARDGDIYVSGGLLDTELIPDDLPHDSRVVALSRWTVAFVGTQFENVNLSRIEIIEENLGGGMIVTFQSAWQMTQQVIEVFEGGLIPDGPMNFSSPPPSRTPLGTGAAVLCAWCPDANGYVVCAAEARKYWIR